MKRELRTGLALAMAALYLAGCATQDRRISARGETTPTESMPKGVASALFPDPAWR
jgi:hypothetical protein